MEGTFAFINHKEFKKRIAKEKWVVVGKVIYNRRNYCKIEIIENQDEQKELDVESFWKIEKSTLKLAIESRYCFV